MGVDPVGVALGLSHLYGKALEFWREHQVVARLFKRLDAAVQADHRIAHGDRDAVRDQVRRLRFDPAFLGGIQRYAEDSDLSALPLLRHRAAELFALPSGGDAGAVADLVVESVGREMHRALPTATEALYHESRVSTNQVVQHIGDAEARLSERITRQHHDDRASLLAQLSELRDAVITSAPSGPTGDFAEVAGEERFFAQLRGRCGTTAEAELRARWEADGPSGTAAMVAEPDGYLLAAAGDVWAAAGRLLAFNGFFSAAAAAYAEAVERGADDAVRLLVRAAASAHLAGEEANAGRFEAEARARAPQHPALRLRALDSNEHPPEQILRSLADFSSPDRSEMAAAECLRSQALLRRGDFEDAAAAADRALTLDPDFAVGYGLRALARLTPIQQRFADGGTTDPAAVRVAIGDLVTARDALLRQRRYDESGVAAVRIAEAHIVLDDRRAALAALNEPNLLAEERVGEAAVELGRVALILRRPELALDVLPSDTSDPDVRLFRAAALANGPDRGRAKEAARELEALLDSGDARSRFAAVNLLHAASDHADLEWSERASAIIGADDPVALAVYRADFLMLRGKPQDAERALLSFSDEPGGLGALVDLALRTGDPETAIARAERLVELAPDAYTHLQHAAALRAAARVDDAINAFMLVADDPHQPDGPRTRAFGDAAEAAGTRRDYAAIERISRSWLAAYPADDNAAWNRAFALARLARHDEALALYAQGLLTQASTIARAVLLAEVLYRAAPAVDAVREIAGLSSRFARADERLEFLVLLAALRHDGELPSELAERVRNGINTFPERFPHSRVLTVTKAPSTPEELDAFAARFLAGDAEQIAQLAEQVAVGQAPVAALAAAAGKSVAYVWCGLDALPLGYGSGALDTVERADAAAAIAKGAAWDSAALFIAALLGSETERAIRTALPTSRLAQAVLDEADDAATLTGLGSADPGVEISYDPRAERGIINEIPAAFVARTREQVGRMLRLAKDLPAAYDADTESQDHWAQLVLHARADNHRMAAAIAPIAVAKRLNLPVYSDDRFMRALARQQGLRAFGTIALLDALTDRGHLSGPSETPLAASYSPRGHTGCAQRSTNSPTPRSTQTGQSPSKSTPRCAIPPHGTKTPARPNVPLSASSPPPTRRTPGCWSDGCLRF